MILFIRRLNKEASLSVLGLAFMLSSYCSSALTWVELAVYLYCGLALLCWLVFFFLYQDIDDMVQLYVFKCFSQVDRSNKCGCVYSIALLSVLEDVYFSEFIHYYLNECIITYRTKFKTTLFVTQNFCYRPRKLDLPFAWPYLSLKFLGNYFICLWYYQRITHHFYPYIFQNRCSMFVKVFVVPPYLQ